MTKTCIIAITLFLCLTVSYAYGQKIIRGFVKNKDTGEVLPIANIQVEGTFRGTISNGAGEYILEVKQLPATLLVRYIGYRSKRITIDVDTPNILDILMEPTVIEFKEIVVTDEDPAVDIMRKVIQKKQEWRAQLETFRAEAYTRLVLENDTSIVSIAESTSELFWDFNKGRREMIKSNRVTANVKSESIFAPAAFFPNFYDDDINLQGNKIMGPTHPDALKFYYFKLVGEHYLDDCIVYNIAVIPKSKLQPAFTGHILVLDQDFAMLKVDLRPNESILYPPPIRKWNFYYQQQFSNFNQAFWLPVDVRTGGDIKISMVGLEFPTIKFYQLSHIMNYDINVSLPDSLYRDKKILHIDSVSVKKDTLLVSEAQIIPLTESETKAYASLDSTKTLITAFQPKGFLARFAKIGISSDGLEGSAGSSQKNSKSILSGFRLQAWHNRVDDFHLGLKYKKLTVKHLTFESEGGYKTGLARWSYSAGLAYQWGKKTNGSIYLHYAVGTDTRYQSAIYPMILNSANTLFGFNDYFDYFWNKKFGSELGYRFNKINTHMSVAIYNERHTSVTKTNDRNLRGRDRVFRPNPAIEPGTLTAVNMTMVIGNNYIPFGTLGQRRISVTVEHSSPEFLASDFSFTRYNVTIDWRIATFFKRRFLPNNLDLRLVAGTATGELPIQRMGLLDVGMASFTPFGVFKTLQGQPLEGEKYLGVFWEHHFRTVPLELIGFRKLAQKGFGIILHGASGRTWISDSRLIRFDNAIRYHDAFYHEIGLSLNSILGIFRLDFTKRLDKPGIFVGFGLARLF